MGFSGFETLFARYAERIDLLEELSGGLLIIDYGGMYALLKQFQEQCVNEVTGESSMYFAACDIIQVFQARQIELLVVRDGPRPNIKFKRDESLAWLQIIRARARLDSNALVADTHEEDLQLKISRVPQEILKAFRHHNVPVVNADGDADPVVAALAVQLQAKAILAKDSDYMAFKTVPVIFAPSLRITQGQTNTAEPDEKVLAPDNLNDPATITITGALLRQDEVAKALGTYLNYFSLFLYICLSFHLALSELSLGNLYLSFFLDIIFCFFL